MNPRIITDEHPIPRVEDLLNKMQGASIFCHLHVTDAYSHFTIANIPAIWQRCMENVLKDVPNVSGFFDDILVYVENFQRMISSLRIVLTKIREKDFTLREVHVSSLPHL